MESPLIDLIKKDSSLQVILGDNAKYAMKGTGSTSLQLDCGNSLKMSDILCVLGLKRNFVSISALEDKGYRVAFIDGKVLIWHKTSSLDSASEIGV